VASYTICPMYETETDSYPCRVTEGPNPFPVMIAVVPPQGGAQAATIKFTTAAPENMRSY
jgi:hypothetical protein